MEVRIGKTSRFRALGGERPMGTAICGGRLKRSARAVQLFGRLAVLETHTLRY